MAVLGQANWTPVEVGEGGDLGTTYRPVDLDREDTSYLGHGGEHSPKSAADPYSSVYEMIDMNEQPSSASFAAPLLSAKDPNMQKGTGDVTVSLSTVTKASRFGRQFSGWKVGVVVCSTTAVVVCILNIALTIWATASHSSGGGLSYLYTGSCSEVAKMSLWIHLAINALSTLLLSASNYTMQVISSPTRNEVGIAHQKGRWLDIGIPSTRNLRGISRTRIIMWSILGLSSVPLHLMYNTAIFSSTTANAYDYIAVTEDFLQLNAVMNTTVSDSYAFISGQLLESLHELVINGSMTKLDNSACMARYANVFVSNSRNVILVSSDISPNNTYLQAGSWNSGDEVPFSWLCGDDWDSFPYSNHLPVCTLARAQAGASTWRVFDHPIDYCFVQEVQEECQLRFSLTIMIIVILANATKASMMILTWWKLRTPTLVTIGDAVTSFLDNPDPTTAGLCLATKHDFKTSKVAWTDNGAKRWVPKSNFWFKAVSVKRWLTCNILCCFFIILGIVLLREGMSQLGIYDIKTLWQLGFGQINANAVVNVAPNGLIAKVLFANLPQGILSFLYLTYNGLYTCMVGAHEWSLFGTRRTGIRVTSPVAQQRSTYYLQLPYWYAIPLLILSGLLHWLMSQSLFLALVDVLDDYGELSDNSSISTVGYSSIAIFFAIMVGLVAVITGVANGFRRFNDGIPLVGSCSAAISAACHRPSEDTSASLLPLQWGCVDADASDNVGHCCLTSFEVMPPEAGFFYAGKDKDD